MRSWYDELAKPFVAIRNALRRAAGWIEIATVDGRSWNCESRPRVDRHPTQDKLRFEIAV